MYVSTIVRAVMASAIVFAAYWAYALAAVPLIEPEVPLRESRSNVHRPVSAKQRYQPIIAKWFEAGSWELDPSTKVIRSKQYMLLLQDYETANDGRQLHIKPLTVLFNPEALGGAAGSQRPMILQAPEGAVLDFDRPFDLQQGGMGRIVRGRLNGQIAIRGPESKPGAGDAVVVSTRSVQIDAEKIWTPNEVHFRIGPNIGSGRDLMVRLNETIDQGDLRRLPGALAPRIQSIEIVKLDDLQIVVPTLTPDHHRQNPAAEVATNPSETAPPEDRFRVTCQGPLEYDAATGSATLNRSVVVTRRTPRGEIDQIHCERLSLQLSREDKDRESGLPKMQLTHAVAGGQPAVVDLPTLSARARGQRIELNLLHHRILVQDSQQAMLAYKENEVTGSRLEYHFRNDGRLGRADVQGPGTFRRAIDSHSEQPLQVSWQEQFQLQPDVGGYILTVKGRAHVDVGPQQQLNAGELHIRLAETSAGAVDMVSRLTANQQTRHRPWIGLQRVIAINDVQFVMPRLAGETQHLEVAQEEAATGDGTEIGLALSAPMLNRKQQLASDASYVLHGDRIQLLLSGNTQMPELAEVNVVGRVHFFTKDESQPQNNRLEMTGQCFQYSHRNHPGGAGLIEGSPAVVKIRDVELIGSSIHLDRERNLLSMNNAGSVSMPLPPKFARQFSRKRATAQIHWQQSMRFDGHTITCEKDVELRGPAQWAKAQTMVASLTQHVDFSGMQNANLPTSLDEIELSGVVELENQTFDDAGLATVDKLSVQTLRIKQETGDIVGTGPGWFNTVRKANGARQPAAFSPADGLVCVRVEFESDLVGNLHQPHLEVTRQVSGVYGRVQDWRDTLEINPTNGPSEGTVALRCTRMSVTQVGDVNAGSGPFELVAEGNTEVEGATFTARAHRLRYAQARDVLVMEGDGRDAAQLWHQTRVGGPRSHAAARKIQYWISDNKAKFEGILSGDLSHLSGGFN